MTEIMNCPVDHCPRRAVNRAVIGFWSERGGHELRCAPSRFHCHNNEGRTLNQSPFAPLGERVKLKRRAVQQSERVPIRSRTLFLDQRTLERLGNGIDSSPLGHFEPIRLCSLQEKLTVCI